jgi:hypothetical protein
MRMVNRILCVVLLLISVAANAEPRSREVTLKKRTELTAYIVPDLGTRFTFPFILDEQDAYVPFTLDITNKAFVSKREPGRNYFVVTAPTRADGMMLGNVFITIAGYEISVELRTTTELSKHYSDVVFKLSNEDREELIQQGVRQRTAALTAEYKKKFEDLDKAAEYKAIAHVARMSMKKPSNSRIKEDGKLKLPNGDSIKLYVDQAVYYDQYTVILFSIQADSDMKGVGILDVRLFEVDVDGKQVRPLETYKEVPARLQARDEANGAVSMITTKFNPKNRLRLQLVTDKGNVEAEW